MDMKELYKQLVPQFILLMGTLCFGAGLFIGLQNSDSVSDIEFSLIYRMGYEQAVKDAIVLDSIGNLNQPIKIDSLTKDLN